MPWKKPDESSAISPATGETGGTCASCGSKMEPDQRYCVNCGARREGERFEFEQALVGADTRSRRRQRPAEDRTGRDWTPLAAVGSIAVLGAMLLLGVLIGRESDEDDTVTTAPATVTTPAATAPATTPGVATTPTTTAPTGTAPTPTTPPPTTTPTPPPTPPAPPSGGKGGRANP